MVDASEPTSRTDIRPALRVHIPVATGDLDGGDFNRDAAQRLVDFRNSDKAKGARDAYLGEIDSYLNDLAASALRLGGAGTTVEELAQKADQRIRHDLDLASSAWIGRVNKTGLGTFTLGTISALALMTPEGAGEWAALGAGVATLGIGAVTLVRDSRVNGYLTTARRAGVLGTSSG